MQAQTDAPVSVEPLCSGTYPPLLHVLCLAGKGGQEIHQNNKNCRPEQHDSGTEGVNELGAPPPHSRKAHRCRVTSQTVNSSNCALSLRLLLILLSLLSASSRGVVLHCVAFQEAPRHGSDNEDVHWACDVCVPPRRRLWLRAEQIRPPCAPHCQRDTERSSRMHCLIVAQIFHRCFAISIRQS